jgi:hypothetical protein
MIFGLLADFLVAVHFAFLLFVVLGGLLVARWPRATWLHLPAAAWGAFIELSGGICPLTPWEQSLRRRAGQAGYTGGFIEHYLIPVLYPSGLTPTIQLGLGAAVIAINVAVYRWAWRRRAVGGR